MEDKNYVKEMNDFLDIKLAQEYNSQCDKWEIIKLQIRNFTLKFAARKNKATKNKLAALEKKLGNLEGLHYFLSMEIRKKNMSTIDVLIRENGIRATFRDDIMKEQTKFCTSQKIEELQSPQDCLKDVTIPKLTNVEKLSLDDPLVIEEVIEAIKALRNKKSPGIDGISIEYFKCFSAKITPLLLLS